MPHQRDWIDYLVAFAPLIAIAVAIGVALMQAYLQQQQLKQNLYDKRWVTRKGLQDFWSSYMKSGGKQDPDTVLSLGLLIADAENLFGSDVLDHIQKYWSLIAKLDDKDHERQTLIDKGETSPELDSQIRTLQRQFMDIVGQGRVVFRPYLQLHQDKNWFARAATRMDRWVNQDVPSELKKRYPE